VFEHTPLAPQLSVVQLKPSLQLAHTAPLVPHTVVDSDASAVHVPEPSVPQPVVQHEPDSQRPPVHDVPFDLLLHAVVLVAVLQLWQAFDGLTAPFA
jgi:hypothetical protein